MNALAALIMPALALALGTSPSDGNTVLSDKLDIAQVREMLSEEANRYYERLRPIVLVDEQGNPREFDKNWTDVHDSAMQEAVPRMDSVLQKGVLAAFTELRNVSEVARALENVVVFREVRAGTFDTREVMQHPLPGVDMPWSEKLPDKDKLPLVLYWACESRSGARVYIVMNSLLSPKSKWVRGLTGPYIITVLPTECTLTNVFERPCENFDDPHYPPSTFNYFLDSVDNRTDFPSLVAILYHAANAGGAFLVYRLDYAPSERTWKRTDTGSNKGGGYTGIEMYYDAASQKLHYLFAPEGETDLQDAVFDVREWIRQK